MIVIIAAMLSEVEVLTSNLNLKSTQPYNIYEGKYQGQDVMLIISGIGKTNASSALSHILTLHPETRFIINLGIVGGHKVNLYDTYLVSEVTYHDVDLTIFNYEYGQIPKYPTLYFTDTKILNKLEDFNQIRLYTGDIFSTKPINPNSYIVDMEGASIYQVAHSYKYPVLAIKVVSDVLGSHDQMEVYKKSETELSNALIDALDQVLEVI
ncbi:5'-methylthioadenosine/S-adenosylhomocysteine nucleosidase [Acholeplasma laidlawii]|uniref:adenosylhomocysteine nucleosidase n=1 Tax=Acholeplasma laidlawii TaxID=2148 RepID=A0A553IFY1_ACHLA|nr:5'-methylthioadenosine/S-adenosylhomocysteine nucleosidase [Acholeplasma laidlawii]TRX99110.1 5'-methylthioadenosine/S-adenosylhomocysteine nucleosidase [Acholeplasma laidlawii]